MDKLSKSLQENLLVLLCYNDRVIPTIANNVEVELFEGSIYREIASQAVNFHREFKKPIGEHLPDVLEDILKKGDAKAQLYKDIIVNIYKNRESVDADYVMGNLQRFVDEQHLKLSIKEAMLKLEAGDIEGAQTAIAKSRNKRLAVFDAGIKLGSPEMFSFLDWQDKLIHTGIKELDKLEICPSPAEMMILTAMPNFGKSWFEIHMGKMGILQRKKVLHISLEMHRDKVAMRYVQSLFSMPKRNDDTIQKFRTIFVEGEFGQLANIKFEDLPDVRSTLQDANLVEVVMKRFSKMRNVELMIQHFPTSTLTIPQLRAFIENLISMYNFKPDMILLDYPDLMKINPAQQRLETGLIYRELRGIGVEYNLAMVPVSQTNREAENVRWITRKFMAEDYSKVMIADNHLTYNQSEAEYKLGLARLLVDKGRNDRRGDKILIAQNYSRGQFCYDSASINDDYWEILGDKEGKLENNDAEIQED